jgi:uncharacterized membrane protein YphA (DoxX/SURF4 family)
MKITSVLSWICQIVAAIILGLAAYSKFMGSATSLYIFSALDMGVAGRLLIGGVEGLAALMLVYPLTAHYGALLGFGTMIGATIAHVAFLGHNILGDGGRHVVMLVVVVSCSLYIMYHHRRSLPLIRSIYN